MWVALICGVVIYKVVKLLFKDDASDITTTTSSLDAKSLFSVADRLKKIYGGQVYVGLHIPDPDSATRHSIDLVHLTEGEAAVISVKNKISGSVTVDKDGNWVSDNHLRIPNPVVEAQMQVSILQSYLEQRGIDLPQGSLSWKVICPNPDFCTLKPKSFPSQVITYDQWLQLKSETKNKVSGWIKGAICGGDKEMHESLTDKLNFVLSTAPMWDRIELKGNRKILGEFLEFKGKQEDVQMLLCIKRSKVSRLIIQQTSMFGLAHSRLQVLYSPRDYHAERTSASEWKEVNVRSSTEVVVQQRHSNKVRKYKLSSVVSIILSA